MITISIDTSKLAAFEKKLSDFPHEFAEAKKQALMEIGEQVRSRAMLAFRSAPLRPSPWAPRKGGGSHPLLIKSGSLSKSVSYRTQGDDTVVIGSPFHYAIYHQRGTKRMPARPFFPVDKNGRLMMDVENKVKRIVKNAYMDALKKLGFR